MPESPLQLPARKPSIDLLGGLDQPATDALLKELLHELWDLYEAKALPRELAVLIRDWLAHANFERSPVAQERLGRAQKAQSA